MQRRMPRKHKTMKKLIVQIIKFGIVGASATVFVAIYSFVTRKLFLEKKTAEEK